MACANRYAAFRHYYWTTYQLDHYLFSFGAAKKSKSSLAVYQKRTLLSYSARTLKFAYLFYGNTLANNLQPRYKGAVLTAS